MLNRFGTVTGVRNVTAISLKEGNLRLAGAKYLSFQDLYPPPPASGVNSDD